ncbi:hypothetical protein AAG570_003499 [Ranatra chinensis]|uniref:Methyltransferase domain-containing protein n=1 Tax=Ranatra chinensis TaxID=642074 RepID=A0ABD0YQK6_9HEMI
MNNPRLYTIGSSLQIRDAKEILEQHMHKLSWGYGEKVLDIGCGPGTVTTSILQPLLPADATLVGCDLSEKMVAFASAMYGNETIKFRQMDVSKPNIWDEWEKEEFDKVFSFYCLNWIHNQRFGYVFIILVHAYLESH